MGYALLDKPNPHGPHYYPQRRGRVLACVVHITAGLEDLHGADSSCEQTVRYAQTTERKVSWHSGSDSDTAVLLLPDDHTGFQCQGYNSTTIGHEISKANTNWSAAPDEWVARTLARAADCLRPRLASLGIPLRQATRAELDQAIAKGLPPVGLIAHSALDPGRRSDPGADFPWPRFLALLANTQEDHVSPAQEAKVDELRKRVDKLQATVEAVDRHNTAQTQILVEEIRKAAGGSVDAKAIADELAARLQS